MTSAVFVHRSPDTVRAETDIIDALIPDPHALNFKQPVFLGQLNCSDNDWSKVPCDAQKAKIIYTGIPNCEFGKLLLLLFDNLNKKNYRRDKIYLVYNT